MTLSTTSESAPPAAPLRPGEAPFTAGDFGLYGATLFVWGTSWYAIKLQLGVVAPEVSLVWRFGLATILMALWAWVSGVRLRFAAEIHARFAAIGVLMFSTNFALFYYAGLYVPSGLLAVIFSTASIGNMLFAALLYKDALTGRMIAGAVLGLAGVLCLFLPEVLGTVFDGKALFALAMGGVAVICFCAGGMVARSLQNAEVPLVAANLWGMVYGTAWMAVVAFLSGDPFIIDTSPAYLGSLLWLAFFSTVIAFAAYLSLLRRIGPGRAGYATVMFPVIALAISTVLESYQWTLVGGLGVLLALGGNLLVLRRSGG